MKQELDRVKNDMETIQKAMGLPSPARREWVEWMRRDNWLNLWMCLPGLIPIVSALLPLDNAKRYFGLAPGQWTGILMAISLWAVATVYLKKITAKDGRPESLIREYRRINLLDAQGMWLGLAFVMEFLLYFIWGKQYQISFPAFWSGLWMLLGASCLVAAVASKIWSGLGWAIPLIAYGLFYTVLPVTGKLGGVPLGIMFIAVGLSFSGIQTWQIRKIEREHESH